MLVWPADSPADGDLKPKRDTSDQACLAVSDLVDKHGSAPITTVTYARQRLLDYGQPALQLIRSRHHAASRGELPRVPALALRLAGSRQPVPRSP